MGCVEHGEAIVRLIHDIKLKGTDSVLFSSFWRTRQHPGFPALMAGRISQLRKYCVVEDLVL